MQTCTSLSRELRHGYKGKALENTRRRGFFKKLNRSRSLVNLSLYCQSLYPGEDLLLLSPDLYITFLMRMTSDQKHICIAWQNPTMGWHVAQVKLSGSMIHCVGIIWCALTEKNMTLLRKTLLTLSATLTTLIYNFLHRHHKIKQLQLQKLHINEYGYMAVNKEGR